MRSGERSRQLSTMDVRTRADLQSRNRGGGNADVPSLHQASSPMGRSARRCGARGYADRGEGGARPGGREQTGRGAGRTSPKISAIVESAETGAWVERAATRTDDAVRHAMHSCAGASTEALAEISSGAGVAEAPDGSGCRPKAAVRDTSPAAQRTARITRERRIRRSIILSKPSGFIVFLSGGGWCRHVRRMRP
jgi:hypothetical protein